MTKAVVGIVGSIVLALVWFMLVPALVEWRAEKQASGPNALAVAGGSTEGAGERIVSLAPSLTEIFVELGEGHRLVGVTQFCAGVGDSVARVGGLQLNVERVVALEPDRVFAIDTVSQADSLRALGSLGIEVEVLRAETVADVRQCVARLGSSLGRMQEAAVHAGALDRVMKAPAPPADAPRVLFVVDWRPLYVAGAGSFVEEMLHAAGARNLFEDRSASYLSVDLEEVIARDPDWIVDVTLREAGDSAPSDDAGELPPGPWARFAQLQAVKSGRVHGFSRVTPGIQIPEWVEQLRRILQSK